jgi:IclR family transcriptional regulator, KDG regulon repressor
MNYTVAAVHEAMSLLTLVARNPGLGVTEISRRSGNTKGRTFRLLATLEELGFVARRGSAALYHLGVAALEIGTAAQGQMDVVSILRDPMDMLAATFNETVVVRMRDGHETVCVSRYGSTRALRPHGAVGSRHSLYAGASSKVLLAFAPADVQAAVLVQRRDQFTQKTLTDRQALVDELKRVRRCGYSFSDGERADSMAALAVPVRDRNGAVIASLSISAPSSRMQEPRRGEMLEALLLQAALASGALGYAPTTVGED